MRVLLCGGGTAGHVNPAIAIAETITKKDPTSKIAYVVTSNGIENDLVKFRKYKIEIQGFNKLFDLSNFKKLLKLKKAIKDSRAIINRFRPDVIIGTGGYATFPVIYAGQKLGIKTVLHESNAIPGKAIKGLQKKADIMFINFKDCEKYFKYKGNIIYSGNPVRAQFSHVEDEQESINYKEKYVILCYGGSLGAPKVNEIAVEIVENYIRNNLDVRFILSTGKREYDKVIDIMSKKRLNTLKNVEVYPYIYNMGRIMKVADIVICRAGAMTISELSACGKCSILIPSPNVANNHQFENAKMLERKNATRVVVEKEKYLIVDTLRELLTREDLRNQIGFNIKKLHNSNSNELIYNEIKKLLE